ncbi:MAG: LytTR family DNA-binding domain-containing protein [Chromatiales bacterium]|jgi:hypothetical protein
MNFGGIDTRKYFIAIGLFLALLFTVLGPQGSADGNWLFRLLQWSLQVAVPMVMLITTHLLLSKSTLFDRLNPWVKLTISGLIGGLLFTPIALALDFLLGVDQWLGFDDSDRIQSLLLDEIAGVVPPVMLVWIGMNAPRVLGLNFSLQDKSAKGDSPGVKTETAGSGSSQSADGQRGFLSQLPASIGLDIICLMAELHYLRVVTSKGQSLVLYNLRDAIAELSPETGIQTHRSYWAAYDHVVKRVTRDGRTFLVMDDGSEVPVSRRRAPAVKKAIGQLA